MRKDRRTTESRAPGQQLPASKEDRQHPNPDCPGARARPAPQAHSSDSTRALLSPGNAEQQARRMRASSQGPSPARRVWGKFGEVCLGSGGRPKDRAATGMRPGAPWSPGSQLGRSPRIERQQKVGRGRPFVCGTGESLAHKRSSALRRRLSLLGCTSASEALHYSRALPPPPPGPGLCSA